jgi:protein-histidine pros-kinase
MLQRAHSETRRLISGVRPPILDESGIAAAIAHLVHSHAGAAAPKVNFHSDVKVGRLAKVLENAIYRIAQESLANALQHSGSERIAVSFIQENGSLRLEVQDWGVGFDPESVAENRFGLEGIRERIKLLGGELSIQSEPGKGTRILAVLPIMEEE